MQLSTQPREVQETLRLINVEESEWLFGPQDQNLRLMQKNYRSRISARGDLIIVTGAPDEVATIIGVLKELLTLVRQGNRITPRDVEYVLNSDDDRDAPPIGELFSPVTVTLRGRKGIIKPKSPGQRKYLQAITENDIVFGIGPAGTGKTYLAVANAIVALEKKQVRRIILARPAVEAGESLGYLPGDLRAKVDPFLRPLYDALYDMLSPDVVQRYLEQGVVEIAPLAYMRGRTLNQSFVIMDEAQNTTPEQMKMFLTRLGFDSKAVITGDVTQIDLPVGKRSGLVEISTILRGIEGISFVQLNKGDIVRHPLVQKIVEAYETHQQITRPDLTQTSAES